MPKTIRLALIGAGGNMKARHIPGFRALPGVEVISVCNRRKVSTEAVAREYGIPKAFEHWRQAVEDPDVDAVVIGTWPYLHCPITLAALRAGKHVLTEARLAMNAAEAHRMLEAARKKPRLVAQVVPSPFGLAGRAFVKSLIAEGYLGELREVHVFACNAALADPATPLSWRQDAALSGVNMLTLGIVHESVLRWVPPVRRVLAQVHAFIPSRIDPESGVRRQVGTPDSVQVLLELEGGVRATYHFSGMTPFGQRMEIQLYGSDGCLVYDLAADRVFGRSRTKGHAPGTRSDLEELTIPAGAPGWRVEADFIDSIREGKPVELTDFATGVAYMEFTEAVARSAESGQAVELPLYERAEKPGPTSS